MSTPAASDYDYTSDLRTRIVNLEHWRTQRDIADARADEQRKHLDARFDALEGKIKSINDLIYRIAWLIVGGLLTGVVAYALKGGFDITIGA
jgi:hypothetical protein